HAGDVVRIGPMVIAAGKFLLVQRNEHSLLHGISCERLLFLLAAIAPEDAIRLADCPHAFYPVAQRLMLWSRLPEGRSCSHEGSLDGGSLSLQGHSGVGFDL